MVVDVGIVKNRIKPKADSTLRNMRKDDLIEYIRCLEHNYNVAVSFNENQAKYIESLTVQQWIPVTERLPEEHDSIFTSFHGTEKWQDGMFLKCSDTVLASVEYEDCKRRVKAIVTKDGKWDLSKMYRASKVTHWMPLPLPPKEG